MTAQYERQNNGGNQEIESALQTAFTAIYDKSYLMIKYITVVACKILGIHIRDPYTTGTHLIHCQVDLYYGD